MEIYRKISAKKKKMKKKKEEERKGKKKENKKDSSLELNKLELDGVCRFDKKEWASGIYSLCTVFL